VVFGALPAVGVFLLEDDGAQAAELVAIFVTEFVEASVGLSVRLGLHGLHQFESLGGDVGNRLPLVLAAAGAADQASGL
jgi:hypothetical protein